MEKFIEFLKTKKIVLSEKKKEIINDLFNPDESLSLNKNEVDAVLKKLLSKKKFLKSCKRDQELFITSRKQQNKY